MKSARPDGVKTLGNAELLRCDKVAFLSSRKVPPRVVIKCYDWAVAVRDSGRCVIGGFQSALERDVLRLLLERGTQPVVMVLARKMWQVVPMEYRAPIESGRLLVVSPVSQSIRRVSEASALVRNRYVLQNCASAMFAAIHPGGSLERLLGEFPELKYDILADQRLA